MTYKIYTVSQAATVRNVADEAEALAKLHEAFEFKDSDVIKIEAVTL